MTAADIEDILELTPLQHGMIYHSIAEPDASVYFEQVCFDLPAIRDLAKFRHAWAILVDRHQIMRSAFHWRDLDKPLQVIHRRASIDISVEDWSHLDGGEAGVRFTEFLHADRVRGLVLERPPPMRITLLRLDHRRDRFVASFHHALLDGWSLGNLFKEFGLVYEALLRNGPYPLRPIPSYSEFIRWLRDQDPDAAATHWRRVLEGYEGPPANFEPDESFGEAELHLSEAATTRLTALASERKVTLNTVVQAAVAAMLWRHTGETDVVFGAVVSGRPGTLPGVESMVGLFINTIPVRVRIDPERTVADQLAEIQHQQVIGRDHCYVSLVDIHRWSDVPPGIPLFTTLLIFENHPMAASNDVASDLEAGTATAHERTNYPITILVSPGANLGLKVQCNGGAFSASTVARRLATLLEAMGRDPRRPMSSLSMHGADETDRLFQLARGPEVDRPFAGVHELFDEQVAKSPDAVSVVGGGHEWTFEQLAARSNVVAQTLTDRGIVPGDVVAVCCTREPLLGAVLLGVLRTGAMFLPLDPSAPDTRTQYMVSDSGASVVLVSHDVASELPSLAAETIVVDAASTDAPAPHQAHPALPDDAAYVIYTSGSTGHPKGVVQTHGASVNRFQWMWDRFPFEPADVACQKTSLSFVDAIWEIFGPLLRGVPLRFIDERTAADPDAFVDELRNGRVTRLVLVPSLLAVLVESDQSLRTRLPDLDVCICSGEHLPRDLAQSFLRCMPHTRLVNLYGSSEVAADVTAAVVTDAPDFPVTIGTPIDNVATYLLDGRLEPVPIGIAGEIYVGGAALARGYLGRPGLTATHFVPDPFTDGGRLFRTGDRARWLPSGEIEFLGRRDHQVKVRGVRIELAEVEAALRACPGVDQAVAVVVDPHTPRANLVARVTTTDPTVDPVTIRSSVADRLATWLVPAHIEIVGSLPLLPNGKIDRLGLESIAPRFVGAPREAPSTETERTLAVMWHEVLGVPVADRDASFFALGGHSLTVMQLVSRVRRDFGVEVALRQLFDAATLRQQASVIDRAATDGSPPDTIRRLERTPTAGGGAS